MFATNFNLNKNMIPQEIYKLKSILDSFLGDSKKDLDDSFQLQYPCPKCREDNGEKENRKFNLEISLSKQLFNCWKCSSIHDEMHGSIIKLIKLYGNETILREYKETIYSLRQSKLYEVSFDKNDFNIDTTVFERETVKLPSNFKKFNREAYNASKAIDYLTNRGIDWDIIDFYNIGYTMYDENNKQVSSRIIIPSFNKFGELNYWTGRDYLGFDKRQKYYNPQIERKDIIFNEEKIQWDADITLVEGPFDHIVVPNSIPLLGKVLKTDFKLYQELISKSNANINIFLDSDAVEDVKKIYKVLNHNRLYNKIRWIPTSDDLDPSKIFELYGYKGIVEHLRKAEKINEIFLT